MRQAATKTKPRLGSEPGQSRSYCGQSPPELQATGETGFFGAFRRRNPLKPVVSRIGAGVAQKILNSKDKPDHGEVYVKTRCGAQ
jgi:hypothetical protein